MENIPGIRYFKEPELKQPVMLAAWPGMGAVATQAVDYIRSTVKAELFAEIETRDFNVPHSVVVTDGIASFSDIPRILLFYSQEHDLIFCEGEEQLSGRSALKVANRLLNLSRELNVSKIFTGAAFVQHMNHREPPSVHVVANSSQLSERLVQEKGISLLKRGQISGFNGSLLGFALQKGIDAACFLSTIPIYAVNLPNPKAARAIIKAWEDLLGFQIDMSELDEAVENADAALAVVEDQLKNLNLETPGGEQQEEMPEIRTTNVLPDSARRTIEQLFESAGKDKAIAHRLKEELDRWDVFKEYEDRFLDLFRESQ